MGYFIAFLVSGQAHAVYTFSLGLTEQPKLHASTILSYKIILYYKILYCTVFYHTILLKSDRGFYQIDGPGGVEPGLAGAAASLAPWPFLLSFCTQTSGRIQKVDPPYRVL